MELLGWILLVGGLTVGIWFAWDTRRSRLSVERQMPHWKNRVRFIEWLTRKR